MFRTGNLPRAFGFIIFLLLSILHMRFSLHYVSFILPHFFMVSALFILLLVPVIVTQWFLERRGKRFLMPLYSFISFIFFLILFSLYFISMKQFSVHDLFVFLSVFVCGLFFHRIFSVSQDPLNISRKNNTINLSVFMVFMFLYPVLMIYHATWEEKNILMSTHLFAETYPEEKYIEITVDSNEELSDHRDRFGSLNLPEFLVNKLVARDFKDISRYVPFNTRRQGEMLTIRIGFSGLFSYILSFLLIPLFLLFPVLVFWYGNISRLQIQALLKVEEKTVESLKRGEFSFLNPNPLTRRNPVNNEIFKLINSIVSLFKKYKTDQDALIKRQNITFQKEINRFRSEKNRFTKKEDDYKKKIASMEKHIGRLTKDRNEMSTHYHLQIMGAKDIVKQIEGSVHFFLNGYRPSLRKLAAKIEKNLSETVKHAQLMGKRSKDRIPRYTEEKESLKEIEENVRELFLVFQELDRSEVMADTERLSRILSTMEMDEGTRVNLHNEVRQSLNTTLFSTIALSNQIQNSKVFDRDYVISMLGTIQNDINKSNTMLSRMMKEENLSQIKEGIDLANSINREHLEFVRFLRERIEKKEVVFTVTNTTYQTLSWLEKHDQESTKEIEAIRDLLKKIMENLIDEKDKITKIGLDESTLHKLSELQSTLLSAGR